MNLLDILDTEGVDSTIEFKKWIKLKSIDYGLMLVNDSINNIEQVIEHIMKIVNMDITEATIITLNSHINGKSLITTGDIGSLLNLYTQFKMAGIKTRIGEKKRERK